MFHVAHAQAALQLGLCKVAVIAYGSTQRTIGRRQASVREYNPVRDAVPAVPAVDRLCARRLAPHAPIRHDARATGRGRGRGARMGPAEPGRLGEEAADDRRGAVGADDQLSVHGARHLPRHRRRRRGDHDHRRARAVPEKAAGLCARLRPGDHPRQYFEHARSDGDRRVRSRAAPPMRWPGSAPKTSMSSSSTTRSRSTRSCSSRISASAQRAKAAALSPTAASRPKGSLPVNTNGGGLSYCHPGMYGLFLLIEAARQLRGECGARQVADCETAIAHGNGGVLSSQSTVILGTQATGLLRPNGVRAL